MSEINVTPFVDVMLVLLIVFMVTAPLLTVGIPINLPKTKATALPEDQTPLSITINKDEKIFLQNSEIDLIFLHKLHLFMIKIASIGKI